jgi:hypothetical protein
MDKKRRMNLQESAMAIEGEVKFPNETYFETDAGGHQE